MSAFGLDPDSIRFGRQARHGEHGDLRPGGLSPFGIRNTGQNVSQVQNALRSLHYVAVTCLPSSAYPRRHHNFHPSFWGRPHVAWGQAPKSVLKKSHYSDILRSYRQNVKNENSMRNILELALLRLKKV